MGDLDGAQPTGGPQKEAKVDTSAVETMLSTSPSKDTRSVGGAIFPERPALLINAKTWTLNHGVLSDDVDGAIRAPLGTSALCSFWIAHLSLYRLLSNGKHALQSMRKF